MREHARSVIMLAWGGALLGWLGVPTHVRAQTAAAGAPQTTTAQQIPGTVTSYSNLLPPDREEIADEERLSWTLKSFLRRSI